MKKLAIIYHSGHGHTEYIARHIHLGAARVAGVDSRLLKIQDLADQPEALLAFDGFIWGSPTYLGGVSGAFKSFMDSTGRLWRNQSLAHRLAAGFTVSSLPAGDKQSTLMSMFVFSMQHGMLWMGNPVLPEQHLGVPDAEAANRLGSWSGLMAQAGHGAPADAFVPGDLKGARRFGEAVARRLENLVTGEPKPSAMADAIPVGKHGECHVHGQ